MFEWLNLRHQSQTGASSPSHNPAITQYSGRRDQLGVRNQLKFCQAYMLDDVRKVWVRKEFETDHWVRHLGDVRDVSQWGADRNAGWMIPHSSRKIGMEREWRLSEKGNFPNPAINSIVNLTKLIGHERLSNNQSLSSPQNIHSKTGETPRTKRGFPKPYRPINYLQITWIIGLICQKCRRWLTVICWQGVITLMPNSCRSGFSQANVLERRKLMCRLCALYDSTLTILPLGTMHTTRHVITIIAWKN